MESGYYPPGAEFDPNAPYNQSDPTPITIEVEAYVTYKKVLKVELDDYVVEEGGVDEDGYTECKIVSVSQLEIESEE